MANKKNTYILLLIVLVIWGLIIYKFFSWSENTQEIAPDIAFATKTLNFKKREAKPLDVNYRDPFLGKVYTGTTTSIQESVKTNIKISKKLTPRVKITPPVKEPLVWPQVLYKGIVSDTKNQKRVFMILIDGKTFLMKPNTTERGILFIEGDRETIELKYKGETRLILIEE